MSLSNFSITLSDCKQRVKLRCNKDHINIGLQKRHKIRNEISIFPNIYRPYTTYYDTAYATSKPI